MTFWQGYLAIPGELEALSEKVVWQLLQGYADTLGVKGSRAPPGLYSPV